MLFIDYITIAIKVICYFID